LLPWTEVIGGDPSFWLEPLESLPAAEVVAQRIRDGKHSKVVALVGYREDAEASEASRHLPYGPRGEGIEEIVFVRAVPIDRIVEFEDDAWPGEDRTYVQDDLEAAIALIVRFAIEYDPVDSAVLVTGDAAFLERVAELVRPAA
jgi:hypothetical protein